MKALFNPGPSLSISHSIFSNRSRSSTHAWAHPSPKFFVKHRDRWIGQFQRKLCLKVEATLDSATIEQLGIPEFDIRNPALSSSYRSPTLPKPNQSVLDAQARVCTGPTQTRPLGEEKAFKVLDTILRSGRL